MRILAIETSCDETAAAIVEKTNGDIKILSNVVSSQIDIHKKFGGVFPEHASRAHLERIIPVVEQSLASAKDKSYEVKKVMKYKTNNFITYNFLLDTIDLIAVTIGPGLIGSLLVGVNCAKTLSYATGKPIIGINHWLGHIYSNFIRDKFEEMRNEKLGIPKNPHFTSHISNIPSFPALILIASGGHTGLVLMKSHAEIETLGETLDDAAGEAFDKVAKLLQLDYPGGPAIAAAATKIRNPKHEIRKKSQILNIKFPRSMLGRKDYNFSFSGLKTAVLYKVKELTKHYPLNSICSQVAFEFQQTVIDILVGKTLQAAREFQPNSICLCGGVSANQELREQMEAKIKKEFPHITFHKPNLLLSTDNAAMIGLAAAYQDESKYTTYDKINADANLKL